MTDGLTIDTDAVAELAAELARDTDAEVGRTAEDLVRDTAGEALAAVRRGARRHRRTGRTEDSIAVAVTGSGDATRAVVTAGGATVFLVGGTRAHTIEPLAGRVLAFSGPTTGFAAHVRHPGTDADPFIARGMRAITGELDTITDTAAARLADRLADRLED